MNPLFNISIARSAIFCLLVVVAFSISWSQACQFDERHQTRMANDPAYARRVAQSDLRYRQAVQGQQSLPHINRQALPTEQPSNDLQPDGQPNPNSYGEIHVCNPATDVVEFPVVVHIMHKGEAVGVGSNRSAAWVDSMLMQANNEWRNMQSPAKHPHMLIDPSTDMKVQFRLARRDPNGNPTSGIVRVDVAAVWPAYDGDDAVAAIGGDDSLVALSHWPEDRYLNIYIMAQQSGSWAYYGGSAFVSYTYALSLGHELAHVFFIEHTFGGKAEEEICSPDANCLIDGDGICDTPPHRNPAYGYDYPVSDCPPVSTTPGTPWGYSLYNVMSYYDLVDGADDVYLFTPGQRAKVRAMAFGHHRSKLAGNALIPVNAALEAGIVAVVPGCGTTIQPQVTLQNNGSQTISSATLECVIDGVSVQTFVFQGAIGSGASATITLNPINITADGHDLTIRWNNINGATTDLYTADNSFCTTFSSRFQPGYPLVANLENGTLPANWLAYGTADVQIDEDHGCANNADYHLTINSFANSYWELSEKTTIIDWRDKVDLRGATSASLTFDLAARKRYYCNYWKSLKVEISADCGASWTTLWHKNDKGCDGPEDPTALPLWTVDKPGSDPESPFVPGPCNDWRNEQIDLAAYLGQIVQVRFVHYAWEGTPDNVYLDNIRLARTPNATATEVETPVVKVYPNPAQGILFVELGAGQPPVTYTLYSLTGQPLQTGRLNDPQTAIAVSEIAAGYYLLYVEDVGIFRVLLLQP